MKDILEEMVGYVEDLSSYWDIFNDKLDDLDGVTILQAILAGIDAATFGIRETIKSTVAIFDWMLDKAGELFDKGKELWDSAFGKKDNEKSDPKSSVQAGLNPKLPKISLPVMANPTMSKALSTMRQHTEIEQDNSLKSEVNVTVYGTDPNSTATATAKELEAIMLRLMTPWSAARIKTIPTS